MSKKNSSGPVGLIKEIIYFIFVCGLIVGIFKITGISDGDSGYKYFKSKSDQTKNCYLGKGCTFDLSTFLSGDSSKKGNYSHSNKTSNSSANNETNDNSTISNNNDSEAINGIPSTSLSNSTALKELNELSIKEPEKVKYDRKEWNHWIPVGHNKCWNSREEGLSNQAKPGSLKYLDKNKRETTDKSLACSILSGEWTDPYSGNTFNKISDLDYDHVAPLAYVAAHGGQNWSKEKKEKYANDPEILIVTSAKENRSKGKKGPAEYMPPNKDFQKDYAKVFIHACHKYGISISKKDKEVLEKALKS